MMIKTIPFASCIAAVLLLQLGGCVSTPTDTTQATLSKKTAISGMPMTAWFFYELQKDCTSAGVPTILVTKHAAHGEVVSKKVDHFPEFPSTNPRSACNTQRARPRSSFIPPQITTWASTSFPSKLCFMMVKRWEKHL
jgi:hypothetical protein